MIIYNYDHYFVKYNAHSQQVFNSQFVLYLMNELMQVVVNVTGHFSSNTSTDKMYIYTVYTAWYYIPHIKKTKTCIYVHIYI